MPEGQGPNYWRSLEHLAASPRVAESLAQEFPGYDPEVIKSMSRRGFMGLMAASMALAGLALSGCRRWPEQHVHPFTKSPEGTQPGVSQHYASILELSGIATGVWARSIDGRPIKIEGNPLHPYSLGAADAIAQASILSLYDPDRSRQPIELIHSAGDRRVAARTWEAFEAFAQTHFASLAQRRGQGLAVLAQPTGSPTLRGLKMALLSAMPLARWHVYEPLHRDAEIEGVRRAFGRPLRPCHDLLQADVIACFDADLLGAHPAHQRHAHDWAQRRRDADRGTMNRIYAVESAYSLTGSVADHRLALPPSQVAWALRALAGRLGVDVAAPAEQSDASSDEQRRWLDQLAEDLRRAGGRALVAVGPAQPAHVHALAQAINHSLGCVGVAVTFTPEDEEGGCVASLRALAEGLDRGEVQTLLILGGNPAYDVPADVPLALDRPGLTSIHLSQYVDETSRRCTWHLPMAHPLECWGDGRAWDGTYSVQQPLILPLLGGRSAIELLAMLVNHPQRDGMALVRQTAQPWLEGDSETAWRTLLHEGLLAGSGFPKVHPGPPRPVNWPGSASDGTRLFEENKPELELLFVTDAKVYDGRFANNGWLQEMPEPLTKLTWDNAALLSKADADRLKVSTGDVVAVETHDAAGAARRLEMAAYIMPGQSSGVVVLPLGYGRVRAGRVGNRVGFDTYRLRTAEASYSGARATLSRTGRRYALAMTQEHHLIDAVGMWGREKRVGKQGQSGYLIREASLEDYRKDRNVFRRNAHGTLSLELFDPPSQFNTPHAWGMAIDLNACTGCGACVVGCQAENNVPIVGKRQVLRRREMHWLRIDRYFKGPVESPDVVFIPMACSHCETAPCEQVCPVAATVHDTEGLNVMVYNRCIGTRYCSNNCPIKTRRFNYFDYHAADPHGRPQPWLGVPDAQQVQGINPLQQMSLNPDVTVRMRGVMEKCTYCTQRIQDARIRAKVEHAQGLRDSDLVRDGEAVPACAAACPTSAIVFGDLNDPNSRVSQLRRNNRSYQMLEELNLRARTQYLAKVRNPAT